MTRVVDAIAATVAADGTVLAVTDGKGRELRRADLWANAGEVCEQLRAVGAAPGSEVSSDCTSGIGRAPALLACARLGAIAQLGPGALGLARLRTGAEPSVVLVEPDRGASGATHSHDAGLLALTASGSQLFDDELADAVLALAERCGLTSRDRILGLAAPSSDVGVLDVLLPLMLGATAVLPAAPVDSDPAAAADALLSARPTVLTSAPLPLARVLDELAAQGESLPNSLRVLLLGRDCASPSLVSRVRAAIEGEPAIFNVGGIDGRAPWFAVHPIEELEPGLKRVPIGAPLSGWRAAVLDEAGSQCPAWVTGALHVGRGDGELVRSGATARSLPSGDIDLIGNEADEVRLQGAPVNVRDIEALAEQLESVRAAALVPGGADELVLFVEPATGEAPDGEAVLAALRGRISPYFMPAHVVLQGALPLAADGRLDRAALRDLAASPALPGDAPPSAHERADALVAMIAEVLELPEVDLDADLLDLGASSAQMIAIANRADEEFGLEVDVLELLELPYASTLVRQYEALASATDRTTTATG